MKLETRAGAVIEVSDSVFDSAFNEPLVHQVVQSFLANGKTGTKAQKTRAQVRGGGSKPWRQKGTGRARAGTRNSPIWVGGGVAFAAKPLVTQVKVNRKMYRLAMASMLSELVRQGRLVVTDELTLDKPSTKALKHKLAEYGVSQGVVLVEEVGQNLFLSSRNLLGVTVKEAASVDPLTLVGYQKVLVTETALRALEELFK